MSQNDLIYLSVFAILVATLLIVTGHSQDGNSLLTVLYSVVAAAIGGHLTNITPGTSSPNVSAPQSGQK